MPLVFLNLPRLASAQEISVEPISISNGLASPFVVDIHQDGYGLIWLATGNGIQRYDGFSYKTFRNIPGNPASLQDSQSFDIEEDQDHNLWIANNLGVSKFDRAANSFVNYNFEKIFNLASGSGRVLKILVDSQGRVFAGSVAKELVQFDPERNTWVQPKYKEPDYVPSEFVGISVSLAEDSQGGVWIGSSTYGLMHLPKGESEIAPLELDPSFGFNSPSNEITALHFDQADKLWIASRQGIYTMDRATRKVTTLKEYTEAQEEFLNRLNCIVEDQEGNIWITNNFRGILKFDPKSEKYREIQIPGNRRILGMGWEIRMARMLVDKSGIFWFGTYGRGLFKYDPVNKPFSFLSHGPGNPNSLSSGGVFGLLASTANPGRIFIGTRGDGLTVLDEKDNSLRKVRYQSSADIFGGSVRSIGEQQDGSLWLGTWGDGLIKVDKNLKETKRFANSPGDENSLVNNQVRVIREDRNGKLWLGTNGGLTIMNPETESFREVPSRFFQTYSEEIIAQVQGWLDAKEEIGIIDQVGAVQNLSKEVKITEAGTYFLALVGEGDQASMADFGWIADSNGDTLAGMEDFATSYHAGGAAKNRMVIEKVELTPGTYTLHYQSDDSHHVGSWNENPPEQLSLYGIALFGKDAGDENPAIISLSEEKGESIILGPNISDIEIGAKYVWVASNFAGITRIDPETNLVRYYEHKKEDIASLSSNEILDLHEDQNGLLWVVTNVGLNIIDPKTDHITKYSEEEGLATNLLEAILPGENGEMWLSSQNGLTQMVRNEELNKVTFINYNLEDGIGGEVFLSLAAGKSPDGRFYFGGEHGLTTFTPVASKSIPPSVIISNLLISNRSVYEMGGDSPLREDLLAADRITLRYDQNDLSFEFAALHFANPSKNQYAHMLVGLDEDWIYNNRNFASYTNLEPGTYEFKVIGSNAYGVWNQEGKTLKITILPPWWLTWWAYLGYAVLAVVLVLAVLGAVRKRIQSREHQKNREKELAHAREIEKAYGELKATQVQLIHSEKMASLGELTAGIAHEIQNPLNFVNNFSEVTNELIAEIEEERAKGRESRDEEMVTEILGDIRENLIKINHHGKRADTIVKGMLQHSRSGSGQKELTDINALTDEYLRLSYHGLRAKDKSFNADFKMDLDPDLPKIHVVTQDIGRVLLNIINNAFYACSLNGKDLPGFENLEGLTPPLITVSTKNFGDKIQISIKDNGPGIPDAVKDKIFQPFFTTKPTGQGTGLGLSLSYDIVKAHGGELKVETEEGKGSTFIVQLPIT